MAFFTFLLLLFLCLLSLVSSLEKQCDANDESCSSTVSPPPLKLPDDFIDPCQDINPSCSKWATEGECQNNPNYMLRDCPRSCKSCQPLVLPSDYYDGGDGNEGEEKDTFDTTVCKDEEEKCSEWAKSGECAINPLYMHEKCTKSCWKCVDAETDREMGVDEETIAKKTLWANSKWGKQNMFIPSSNADSMENLKKVREHYKAVIATLREMDYYAKYIMTDPSVDSKTRERCRNEHRMCADWAASGRCGHHYPNQNALYSHTESHSLVLNEFDKIPAKKDDVIFMMNLCPLACRTCDKLESFHKCTGRRHPLAEPSFISEEALTSFLEEKRTNVDNDWSRFDPIFVSYPDPEKNKESLEDPYVVVFKKFLSDDEVDDYLQSLETCKDSGECKTDKVYQKIMERVAVTTSTTTSHLEQEETLNIMQPSSTTQTQHNFQVDSFWMPAGPRVLSLSLFLSSTTNGEIGFPYLDWLKIKPTKGMAVLWSNVRNDNIFESNPLASYEYLADNSLVSNVHVRMYNYTDASIRGCA